MLILNLTNPAQPQIAGVLNGIGGRLGVDENGLLFGTARSVFGGQTQLGGVKTAALEYVTFIKSAPAVIVDVDGRSIEPQPISYRAIFPRASIATAEVEITDGDVVRKRIEARLDESGAGEVTLPTGTAHSPLRARLVINRDKPAAQRPRVTERILEAAAFDVEPSGTEITLPADSDPVLVTGVSQVLQKRLGAEHMGGPKVVLPQLTWSITGSGEASVAPQVQSLSDTRLSGLYSTSFLPSVTAGAVHRVELLAGDRVLGRSAPIRVVAGEALKAEIEFSRVSVPADGRSKSTIRLHSIRDLFDNPIPDGRTVTWETPDPPSGFAGDGFHALLPGSFANTTTLIRSAETQNEYVAGVEPGWVSLTANLDGGHRDFQVFQAPLSVNLSVTGPGPAQELQRELVAVVTSQAGALPDKMPVGWGVTAGFLEAQPELTGGVAAATFTWPIDPKTLTVGIPHVFATVGRSRGMIEPGIGSAEEPSLSLFLRLLGRRLLVDVGDGSSESVGPDLSVPSALTLQVKGGAPGQTVHLTLDSYRQPGYLPVSHYTFDGFTGELAPDLLGGAPAVAGAATTIDNTEAVQGGASVRLDGGEGLTVAAAEAFAPSGDFGISGYVRLETAGSQTVLSRAGSYEIAVVDIGGQPYLEFTVVNAGETKRVVSKEPLVPHAWRHFAARLQEGRLQLSLGDSGIVRVGDAASPPDSSDAPLFLGGNLFRGNLDEVAFFDFTRSPNVAFSNGKTTIAVTLNSEGESELLLRSLGMFAGVPLGALARYGEGSVRVWQPPTTAEDWIDPWLRDPNGSLRQRYGNYVTGLLRQCGEGISDGESGGAVGAGCDLLIALIGAIPLWGAPVDIAQNGRDAYYGTKHYIEGKEKTGNAVKAGSSVFFVIGSTVNPAQKAAKLGHKALRVVDAFGQSTRRVVLEFALGTIAKKLRTSADEAVPQLLEVLGDETGRVSARTKNLLIDVLDRSRSVTQTAVTLERLGKVYGYEKLLGTLDNVLAEVAANPNFQSAVIQRRMVPRLLESLDEIAGMAEKAGVSGALSDNAIRGIAVMIGHGVDRGWRKNRILNIWAHCGKLNPTLHAAGFDEMMGWIAEGEKHNIKGWVSFLGKGPGTLGESPNATRGAWSVLKRITEAGGVGWPNVVELERGVGQPRKILQRGWLRTVYPRYIDIVKRLQDGTEGFEELKTLSKPTREFLPQLDFDIVEEVIRVTPRLPDGRTLNAAEFARLFGKHEYSIRASGATYGVMKGIIHERISTLLSSYPNVAHLATSFKVNPLPPGLF